MNVLATLLAHSCDNDVSLFHDLQSEVKVLDSQSLVPVS